jgi:glutamine cyclotransferase
MPGQKSGTIRHTFTLLAILAALCLVQALLAGCSSAEAENQPTVTAVATPMPEATTIQPAEQSPLAAAAEAQAAAAQIAAAQTAAAQVEVMPPDAHPTSLVAPKLYTYRVVNIYPHDQGAFTQGLIVRDGQFLEGTGGEGDPTLRSTLRRTEIESGQTLQSHQLDEQYFGEGITEFDGKIYQLTWKTGVGFIYDAQSLAPTGQFQYGGEGWGITHDGQKLIVSDGTSVLQFWDPTTLQPTGGVYVSLFGLPMSQLNELEYFDGAVWANIWQTNLIMRIDPATGQVTGVVDLAGLLDYSPDDTQQPDVLNGIAYDEESGRLFVTGKLWPAVFEIELVEVKQ